MIALIIVMIMAYTVDGINITNWYTDIKKHPSGAFYLGVKFISKKIDIHHLIYIVLFRITFFENIACDHFKTPNFQFWSLLLYVMIKQSNFHYVSIRARPTCRKLGYDRFLACRTSNMDGIASSATAVLLGFIGSYPAHSFRFRWYHATKPCTISGCRTIRYISNLISKSY